MSRHRDYCNELTGPERALGRGFTSKQVKKSGGLAWFNTKQRHAAGTQPNAMELAFKVAGIRHPNSANLDAPNGGPAGE